MGSWTYAEIVPFAAPWVWQADYSHFYAHEHERLQAEDKVRHDGLPPVALCNVLDLDEEGLTHQGWQRDLVNDAEKRWGLYVSPIVHADTGRKVYFIDEHPHSAGGMIAVTFAADDQDTLQAFLQDLGLEDAKIQAPYAAQQTL